MNADLPALASGALAATALPLWWLAARRRQAGLGALALGGVAGAMALWQWRASPSAALPATLAWLVTLALALLLTELALRGWRAGQARRADLLRQLAASQSELEQTRHQMLQAQQAAEAADQAKARFLAAASHDLRQPAHALGLYTAALRAGPLAPEQAEIAQRMQSSLAALDTLFAALLDVSRMDAGAVVPQWDTVPVAPLLRRLADEWAPQAEARGLRMALHVSQPEAMTVTDPLLLERVLRNLLANAVAYTQRGGVLLACRLRGGADGQAQLRIEVWDSGQGIAAADQERVFEEFFQAAPLGTGQGLGLAIVQRLARLLQLRVRLHSQPGRGSVFMLEGLVPTGAAGQMAVAARVQMRRLAGLRVAVMDDDADVRDATRRLLQLWDCRVIDAADADGLTYHLSGSQETIPHALVADLRLADGRSGPAEVQRLFTVWGRAVPVLWISGETAPAGLRASLDPGATVLAKPVSPPRLRVWLEQQIPASSPLS